MSKGEKIFSALICIPIIIASLYGYYAYIVAMKGGPGGGAGPTLLGALDYVERNWQEGDIIFVTDDGPYVNLVEYTDKPIYKMPLGDCQVWGSLSDRTRRAMGADVRPLDDIPHRRAWIFAPVNSPLHSQCYVDAVAQLTKGEPVYVVDDSRWLYSAVWLSLR